MENTSIRLEPVTVNNWKSCIALELAPDQEGFVPSNLYSIAESQFYPDARSTAIYNERNQLVGYALWGRDILADKWKIFRVMVDKSHQRGLWEKRHKSNHCPNFPRTRRTRDTDFLPD